MAATDLPGVAGRPVDLLGAGIDNMALLPHLGEASQVRIWVDDPDSVSADIRAECARFSAPIGAISQWTSEEPAAGRLVVRSPGFPRYRQDIATALTGAEPGSVTTAINMWLGTFGDRYPTVVVTGTKGKSTVARMLASVLPSSELVGNIGTPIWSISLPPEGTVIVCEVSSYQAVDLTHRGDLAILTSLSEDHISWHGSVERYHADKLAPVISSVRALTTDDLEPLLAGHPDLQSIRLASSSDRLNALPSHMATNARLAVAAARRLETDFGSTVVEDPEETLLTLPAMIGRLREIPSASDTHRWFDDSLASNPTGAAAAVAAFAADDLWIILGGLDRNVSPGPLIEAVRACSASVSAIAVPDNGNELIDQLEAAGITLARRLDASDVTEAVAMVRASASSPSTVLFSPGAPTPPQHGNWSNRSAAFEAAVLERPT